MFSGTVARPMGLKFYALCGVIAPILFTLIVTILGFLRPSYSHVSNTISELGSPGAPNAIVQDANFLVNGLLITAFAFGLRRGIPAAKSSRGPALIGALGVVSFVGNAFLPISGAGSAATTTQAIIDVTHISTAIAGFIAFIIATFVFSRLFRKDSMWQGYGTYSRVSGVLATIFLLSFILAEAAQSNLIGVIQRLFVGVMLLWIEVMAIRLLRFQSVTPSKAPGTM